MQNFEGVSSSTHPPTDDTLSLFPFLTKQITFTTTIISIELTHNSTNKRQRQRQSIKMPFMSSLQRAAAALPPQLPKTKKRSIHSLDWDNSMEELEEKVTKKPKTFQWHFVNPTLISQGQITTHCYHATEWIDALNLHTQALNEVEAFFHRPQPQPVVEVQVVPSASTTTTTTAAAAAAGPVVSETVSSSSSSSDDDDDQSSVWSFENDSDNVKPSMAEDNDDPRFVPLPDDDDDKVESTPQMERDPRFIPLPDDDDDLLSAPVPDAVPVPEVTIMFPNLDESMFDMTFLDNNNSNDDDDDSAITEVYNEDEVNESPPMMSSYTACAAPTEGSGFDTKKPAGDNNNNNIGRNNNGKSSYTACATPKEGSGFFRTTKKPAGDDQNKKNEKHDFLTDVRSFYIRDIVKSMSVKQMKKVLQRNNVNFRGVVEKQELAALIWLKTDHDCFA